VTRATLIRDAIADRIEAKGWFVSVQREQMPTLQPADLPLAQVYIMQESMTPDGDSNVGAPGFVAETVIGVSVLRGFDDPKTMAGRIDLDCDEIETALLTDPTFVSLDADALFESVERITRRRLFPKDGEAYFAEVRIEFTFLHRVVFEPVVDDDYAGATVTAKPLGFDTDAPYTKFTIDPPAT